MQLNGNIGDYVWVLWDLCALALFFTCVFTSARRGFAASLLGMLSYVVSAAAAGLVYRNMAGFLYDNMLEDIIRHVLTRNFNLWLDGAQDAGGVAAAIPAALRLLAGAKLGEVDLLPRDDGGALAETVMDVALRDPVMTLLYAACFMLVFTAVAAVIRKLTRLFYGLGDIPVIGPVNTVLGGVAGVAMGLLWLYLGGFALRLFVAFTHGELFWLNDALMEETYICRLFY